MKITIKDLFEDYDLFRHLEVNKEIKINEGALKIIIEDTIEEAFNKGVIDKDNLLEDIYKGVEDVLSDTEVETKVKLDPWSDHDTVDIEVK